MPEPMTVRELRERLHVVIDSQAPYVEAWGGYSIHPSLLREILRVVEAVVQIERPVQRVHWRRAEGWPQE